MILSAALFCAGMAGCGESGAEVKVTEDLESMRYVELDEKVGEEINSMLSDQGKEFFEMFLAKAGEFEYEIIDTDKGGGDESEETVTVRIRTYPFASEYLRTWTDYLESIGNDITGAVNIAYPSWRDRLAGTCQKMRIMQEMILPAKPEQLVQMGGEMMLSCYHIGPHETIGETYAKMEQYAEERGYKLAEDSWERYVTDCWTTNNTDMYVTEVRIGASR